ncbi:DedA family protein [Micromonospora sp. ATCC 39149]|uniref:DedA family protein n=1 Tax=Micromonospora carbonacea TaxID=47853 RepID=A0A7D5Y6Y4_9ACTN|nr:DedA family protein [Micromonospora sp. ATCC 39149]QLJ97139.1 DedA family protein [Micromonospora carbonacea]
MRDLLNSVQGLPPLLVYLVAAAIVAGETAVIVGLLVPGEATLLLVGFLTYTGTLRLGPALLVMILAAVTGDTLAFRAGRRYGPRLRASGFGARVGPHRWRRADALLERLGGRGVCTARWVAFARTLAPRLAGAAGMPYRRFAPWNLAGVVTWVGGSVLAGNLAGESYETVSRLLGRATGVVLVLCGGVLAVVLVGRWLGRHPDPARALLTRAAALPPVRWLSARYGVLFFLLAMRVGPGWTLLINLGAGLVLLFVAGSAIAWLLGAAMRWSGLAVVDDAIADWFADRRTPGAAEVALTVVSVSRGSVLIALVTVVAVGRAWRQRSCPGRGGPVSRAAPLDVVGTVGAFLPLVVLGVVADVVAPGRLASGEEGVLFATQHAVMAASLCTLAWLLSRGARWPVAVAVWTAAAAGVGTIGGARLYLGQGTASSTVTSVLLGVTWTALFMVAWATRERAVGAAGPTGGGDAGSPPPRQRRRDQAAQQQHEQRADEQQDDRQEQP